MHKNKYQGDELTVKIVFNFVSKNIKKCIYLFIHQFYLEVACCC